MNKKVFIFDFDGTIADSFLTVMDIFNQLAEKHNLQKVSAQEIPSLKKLSSQEIINKFSFPKWKLPIILLEGKKIFSGKIPEVKTFPGLKKVILKLHEKENIIGILSSNSEENIKKFLANNKFENIDFIYTENTLFGKAPILKKIIKSKKFNPENVFYIGDETRDIEAAKKCGIKSIAVSWGFNDREILKKYKPDYLIDTPEKLLDVI